MNNTQDERGGWTSASNAEADSLCPGRHLAQRGLPEEAKGEDAESGTRIHAWLEAGAACTLTLTDSEQETAEKCQQIVNEVVPQIFGDIDGSKIVCKREQRMWIGSGAFNHSGKADVIYIRKREAIVLDYKTGRNEATESPRNQQLRDLAVLVAHSFGVTTVHVAIIQPWATMKPEVCTYLIDDLVKALADLESRVTASNDSKSPRIPGAVQCQYCRAKKTCAEFMAASLPHPTMKHDPDSTHPDVIKSGIMAMDGNRLGLFLSLVRLADETATAELRRRLEAGEPVEGWTLKPGRETEKITDAQTVFSRALAAGVTQEKFVSGCITVGKTALKTALKTATELKGKALDAKMDELLEGATETKTSNPILTKV